MECLGGRLRIVVILCGCGIAAHIQLARLIVILRNLIAIIVDDLHINAKDPTSLTHFEIAERFKC